MMPMSRALDDLLPENVSRLAAEIARLMRDGEKDHARELFQTAIDGDRLPQGLCSGPAADDGEA